MSGYIPNEKDIEAMVRDLTKTDPKNANPEYARKLLIKMKLMYRELGHIDEELLKKELETFKSQPKKE